VSKPTKQTRQYEIRCQITRRTSVIVEAQSVDDAMNKFNSGEWIDENPCGEISYFTHDGRPKDIGEVAE
jgi:hypothetical protein